MKISKKIVSLLICMAMLVAMIPTVFAEGSAISVTAKDEAVSKILSTEDFVSIDSAEKTTLTTAESVTLDDGNNVLQMSASGAKYQRAFASPYADVSGGQFSISYDLYVDSITQPASGSTVLFTVGGKNNPIVSGASQWMINFSPFRVTAVSPDYIVWYDTDTRLYTKNWYRIIHYFDAYTGYRTDYIIDSEGNVRSHARPEGNGIAAVQYFSLTSNYSSADFYLDNITLKDESINISSMPENIDVSENLTFNVTLPEGFESALVLADGNVIGNINPVSGKNSYDVEIPAGTLEIGNREIMVSASYADFKPRSTSAYVTVAKENIAGITNKNGVVLSTETETFDALVSKANYSEVNGYWIAYNTAEKNTSWQTNAASYLVPGPSGENGDYGVELRASSNLIGIYNLGTNAAASKGRLVLNFDVLLSAAYTNVQISDAMAFTAGQTNFINANKLVSQIDISPNVWTNINMEYDFDDEVWYITANGQTVTKAAGGTKTFTECRFTLRSASATFAIDNARVYNILEDATVTSASYDSTVITNKAVPASAKTLSLTLSDSTLAPTLDDVEVYADGEEISAQAVSAVDGVVTITLPALAAHTDLDVVIKNTVEGLENDITESFYVTDANGYFFKSAGVVKFGDKIIGAIRHFGNSNFEPIAAAYNDKELAAIKSAEYRYSNTSSHHAKLSGHTAYGIVLTPDAADSAKVMAWDTLDSLTPKTLAPLYNLD